MTSVAKQKTEEAIAPAYGRVVQGFSVLAIVAVIVAGFAVRFANAGYQRDLHQWEIRLGITADTRAQAAQDWVERQQKEMAAVADNTSLRLYMTELADKEGGKTDEAQAASGYLRNYIVDTARKTGFMDLKQPESVPASVEYHGHAGLALLDKSGKPVVMTASMPELDDALKAAMKEVPGGKPSMKDIYLDAGGVPVIAFFAPVFAVQNDEQQIGTVVGIRPVERLYVLLKRPASAEATEETLLVRFHDGVVEYLSPLLDGTKPLERRLDLATDAQGDAKFASEQPGHFGIKRDYAFQNVLVTSRPVPGTPWTLIHKIGHKEAMAECAQRRISLITLSFLGIGFLVVVILAVWRHGSSVRYKHLADRHKSQERLLQLVTDNQPDATFILDAEKHYRFVNLKAAQDAGSTKEELIGKTVRAVLGPKPAKALGAIVEHVLEQKQKVSHVRRVEDDTGVSQKVVQSRYIPLARVPRVLTVGEELPGVLVVEQDITAAIVERERRERLLKDLVETLVLVVDRRDKHSAHHSKRVATVAESVAREMHLDNVSVETVRNSALLMNLGKVMLPVALLTKQDKLTAAEKKQITEAFASGAEYLKGLEFNGPVVETIRQAQERWDGGGPLKLKGDKILLTAQIIAIANDYIAMISPRAYRDGIKKEKALENFLGDVGKRYQRKVVAALVNYLENGGDAAVPEIPEDDDES